MYDTIRTLVTPWKGLLILMRKVALVCATLAALLLVAVVGLGLYGQNSATHTKNDLTEETAIAQQLLKVKKSAEKEKSNQLVALADEQLSQLPETSRDLANETAVEDESLEDSLSSTSNTLIDQAFTTEDTQLRVFLLDSSMKLWNEGLAEKTVEGNYPQALAERVKHLDTCQPAKDETAAPESVSQVMTGLDKYSYAASLFNARADVDGYREDIAQAVETANENATKVRAQVNDTLSCAYQLPARQAAYQVAGKDPQAELEALKTQVKDAVDAALKDPAVTNEQALTELLVLQKSFK